MGAYTGHILQPSNVMDLQLTNKTGNLIHDYSSWSNYCLEKLCVKVVVIPTQFIQVFFFFFCYTVTTVSTLSTIMDRLFNFRFSMVAYRALSTYLPNCMYVDQTF